MAKLDQIVRNNLKSLDRAVDSLRKESVNTSRLKNKSALQKYPIREVDIPDQFYCEWITDPKLKADYQKRYPFCCWNHWFGLPTTKFDDDNKSEGNPLNEYQKRIIENYASTNYYAQNKCRGAGTSELLTVRYNAFKYMSTKNVGRKSLVIAGINVDLAKLLLHRIKVLCDIHPEVYRFPPKSDHPNQIYFAQGGSIWALPANPDSVRSFENVGDVFYEESAFWNKIDDGPVLKAGDPHAIKSKARINSISTPNGKRGFMWDKMFNPELDPATKYFKHTLNWREVVGIPEPDPDVLADFDVKDREAIRKVYTHRYNKDKQYRNWFDEFFEGRTLQDILSVEKSILDVNAIISLYKTDRAAYEQEFDNQFVISENRAFGAFIEQDFAPIDFEDIHDEDFA